MLISLLIYTQIFFAIPGFRELLDGFGGEMPLLTELVLDYSRLTILHFPLGLVPLVAMWRRRLSGSLREGKELRWIIASFGVSLLALCVTTYGVYLPIYKMGAVV